MLRRFASAALCLVYLVMLCGCTTLTFSVDDLMAAPIIADEQAAVHKALIESAGRAVTPSYPGSGDYRSAFVIEDIDSDGNDEALAFYTLPQQNNSEPTVRVAVMDKDDGGSWHSMYELSGRGTAVDTVIIADYGRSADIIIGYENQGYDDKNVSIYRYTNGMLASIFDGSYSFLDTLDIDSCGKDEIVIVKKIGTVASVGVIKTDDGIDYSTMEKTLSSPAMSIAGICFGELYSGVNALFVDTVNDSSVCTTEVVYVSGTEIISPTSDGLELSRMTSRPLGYSTGDYDKDGIVEIPIITPFLGYTQGAGAEYMTSWLAYDSNLGLFAVEAASYYSAENGFVFKLPNRWINLVSVIKDNENGELIFVKYDYGTDVSGSQLQMEEMPRLLSIAPADALSVGSYRNSGYSYVKGTDYMSYMAKLIADKDEPLLLTFDEISENLYIFGEQYW